MYLVHYIHIVQFIIYHPVNNIQTPNAKNVNFTSRQALSLINGKHE